jgi:hypothetical protein
MNVRSGLGHLVGLAADRRRSAFDFRATVIAKTLVDLEKAGCGACAPGRPCVKHCKACRAGRACARHDESDVDEMEGDGDEDD